MPKDRVIREREYRGKSVHQFNRLLWDKHLNIGSEAVSMKLFQKGIKPCRKVCRCGQEILVTVEDQRERNIVSCPECGKRYRASLASIKPI
jgi:hypothetical protein